MKIEVRRGDITAVDVDAIVNAANTSLLGGGGVDGAIHRAAGPQLLEACRRFNGCATGQAVITPGFRLPARHVIHTPGPVWHGGESGEAALLADCYRNSLRLTAEHRLKTLAFPCISTGVYRFPSREAAGIALETVRNWREPYPEKVIFVVFDAAAEAIYRDQMNGQEKETDVYGQ